MNKVSLSLTRTGIFLHNDAKTIGPDEPHFTQAKTDTWIQWSPKFQNTEDGVEFCSWLDWGKPQQNYAMIIGSMNSDGNDLSLLASSAPPCWALTLVSDLTAVLSTMIGDVHFHSAVSHTR